MSVFLQVVTVQNLSQLLVWRDELKTLNNILQSDTFCTDPDWLICWVEHYLNPKDRIALTLHLHNGKLVAAFPLYEKKMPLGYELRFIGTGEPEKSEVCSEFLDFMILPEYRVSSLKLFDVQTTLKHSVLNIRLDVVQNQTNCHQWLKQLSNTWYKQIQKNGFRYTIPLAHNEQEQIRQLSHQSSRRHARNFLKMSEVVVEQCSSDSEIPNYFDELIRLHNQHWQQRGKQGAFATEQFKDFHIKFSKKSLKEDNLLMFRLVVKKQLVAVFYGFYSHDRLFYYQSGISRHSHVSSAGIAMHLIAMRFARIRGKKYYDLMKGKADSYKKYLVNSDIPLTTLTARHRYLGWISIMSNDIFRKYLLRP